MFQQSTINLNILQNKEDFELEPISKQPPIFKLSLMKKTLDPPKANPENINNYRTVTIRCLFKGCT
jgi:hypothetical protein